MKSSKDFKTELIRRNSNSFTKQHEIIDFNYHDRKVFKIMTIQSDSTPTASKCTMILDHFAKLQSILQKKW